MWSRFSQPSDQITRRRTLTTAHVSQTLRARAGTTNLISIPRSTPPPNHIPIKPLLRTPELPIVQPSCCHIFVRSFNHWLTRVIILTIRYGRQTGSWTNFIVKTLTYTLYVAHPDSVLDSNGKWPRGWSRLVGCDGGDNVLSSMIYSVYISLCTNATIVQNI